MTSRNRTEMQQMLDDIALDAELTAEMTGRREFSQLVMDAIAAVPRDQFVPPESLDRAYYNIPLPIGYGQTISQPYIVALMTDLLEPQPQQTCLEVGTGCGYQAAVLSLLFKQVYSVEIIPWLQRRAAERLHQLQFDNVQCLLSQGPVGYPAHAPYDCIIVTAAAERIPKALVEQLKPGGRMVIPVGPQHHGQMLYLITKSNDGVVSKKAMLAVRFVPLVTGVDDPG